MFQVDLGSRIPLYEQLVRNVIALVSAGVFKPGDRLPPVRTLAEDIGINPNTVAKAYKILEGKGYIYTVVGSGSFISDKLGESAYIVAAEKEFEAAAAKARTHGISAEKLKQIIDDLYKGDTADD